MNTFDVLRVTQEVTSLTVFPPAPMCACVRFLLICMAFISSLFIILLLLIKHFRVFYLFHFIAFTIYSGGIILNPQYFPDTPFPLVVAALVAARELVVATELFKYIFVLLSFHQLFIIFIILSLIIHPKLS